MPHFSWRSARKQVRTSIQYIPLTQLFTKAANILYKKYIANNKFKTLVRPSMIPPFATASSITERQRAAEPTRLTVDRQKEKGKKKRCCN